MGWFDETTRTFEVYNQPLYSYPNTRDMFPPILYGILRNEDIGIHQRRAMFSNIDKTAIHKFRNDIENGTYEYGWPTVETNFKIDKTPELQAAIDSYYGTPMIILKTSYGIPTVEDWVLSQLAKDPIQADVDFHVCDDTFTDKQEYLGLYGTYYQASFNIVAGGYIVRVRYIEVDDTEIILSHQTNIPLKPTVPYYIVKVKAPVS